MLFSKSMNVTTNNLSFPIKRNMPKLSAGGWGGEREGSFLDSCFCSKLCKSGNELESKNNTMLLT